MLMIRLQRTGRTHEPTFRVVLTDSKNGPKSGKYLENLGWYDSRLDNKASQLDTERINYWISQGAQLSVTLHNFLLRQKVIEGSTKNALPKHRPIKKAAPEGSEGSAPAAAAPEAVASQAPAA